MEAAANTFGEALREHPESPAALNNLAVILQELGRHTEARTHFERAVDLAPGYADAHYNLAKLLRAERDFEAALTAYGRALDATPNHVAARLNRANLLAEFGRFDEAVADYRTLADAAGNENEKARAYINMGNAFRRAGHDEEARAAYDSALAVHAHDGLAIKRALTVPVVTRSAAHIQEIRARVETDIDDLMARGVAVDDPALEVSGTNFFLAYHAHDNRRLHEKIAALHLSACPALGLVAPHCQTDKPEWAGDRIRLGILSAYLRTHSVGRLNVGLPAQLDKHRFEIIVFTVPGAEDDPIGKSITASADKVVELPEEFFAARDAIAVEELDILYYPEIGMDVRTYFLAFARLAPVQCVGWGHPDTTGIPNIDHFVSSSSLEPEGADEQYSESLVRLTTLPPYYTRPVLNFPPKGKSYFGLPEDRHIYLCPQSAIKLHPDFDAAVSGIREGDPDAEIVLVEGAVPGWIEQIFARMGTKLRVVPRQSPDDYLHLLSAADVILDTPHFSGGNISYESFALGKAVVTHDGEFMRGRVTAAMYRMMGMEACVAGSLDDYVAIALRLGTDIEYRKDVERQISAAADVLFEDQDAVREWERFFMTTVDAS